MSVAKLFTSETEVADGDLLRWDWDESPRFYHVRIHPWDPREEPCHPHLYTPRVQIRVELEGDRTAWAKRVCDDDPESRNEAVMECVTEIEVACIDEWLAEQNREKREMDRDYWRSRM